MLPPLRTLLTWTALSLLLLPASYAGAPDDAQVFRPKGEYQHLWLDFEGGETPTKAFVGLRDGASTVVWFVNGEVPGGVKVSGNYQVLLDASKLQLTGDSLKGTIALRQVTIWAPMARRSEMTIALDASRTGSKVAGKWTAEADGKPKAAGAVSGTLTDEKTLQTQQAFDPAVSWPGYYGPHGTNAGIATKTPLVDDLAQARPVWRAEQALLSGWGTGVDDRYPHRAAVGMVCGGSGSPIYADGRIYLFHFVPAGNPDAKKLEAALAAFEKNFNRPPTPRERESIESYARELTDTVVTCLDARTGAILWRVTFPRLSGNIQTHKWRGLNPTATLVGRVLIANDYAGNWVGLDAQKGEVLWTHKRGTKISGDSAALGAVAAGKLAILPSTSSEPSKAVDPESGKVVWQEPGGAQALVWGKAGQEQVVFLKTKGAICRDAATGKQRWTIEEPIVGRSASAALIDGDMLIAYVSAGDMKLPLGAYQGWKLTESAATKVWQDEPIHIDENLTVSIGKGKAYLVGRDHIRCLDTATGKLLAKRDFEAMGDPGYSIGSNAWLGIVGDRVFLSPEGQHGRQSLAMLDASSLKSLGNRWVPANNSTTAYGIMSIAFPVLDGRVLVRGTDGLYCYDLRK